MLTSIPWINNRKKVILAVILDLIIIIYFYTNIYLDSFNSYPNPLVPILISIY